jgi:hypothetical protein
MLSILSIKVCEGICLKICEFTQMCGLSYQCHLESPRQWNTDKWEMYRENRSWFVLVELLLCVSGEVSGRVMRRGSLSNYKKLPWGCGGCVQAWARMPGCRRKKAKSFCDITPGEQFPDLMLSAAVSFRTSCLVV